MDPYGWYLTSRAHTTSQLTSTMVQSPPSRRYPPTNACMHGSHNAPVASSHHPPARVLVTEFVGPLTHAYTDAYTHAYIHRCIHTCIHTQMHTFTHLHTHMHTRTSAWTTGDALQTVYASVSPLHDHTSSTLIVTPHDHTSSTLIEALIHPSTKKHTTHLPDVRDQIFDTERGGTPGVQTHVLGLTHFVCVAGHRNT